MSVLVWSPIGCLAAAYLSKLCGLALKPLLRAMLSNEGMTFDTLCVAGAWCGSDRVLTHAPECVYRGAVRTSLLACRILHKLVAGVGDEHGVAACAHVSVGPSALRAQRKAAKALVDAGAAASITRAMLACRRSAQLQACGLAVLLPMAASGRDARKRVGNDELGLSAVLTAMSCHPASLRIHRLGWACLGQLALHGASVATLHASSVVPRHMYSLAIHATLGARCAHRRV